VVKPASGLALVAAVLFAMPASASSPMAAGALGLGLGSGTWASPLSARYNLTKTTAVQANVGSYGAYGTTSTLGLALSADYIAMRNVAKRTSVVTIGWNLGVGAGLGAFSNVTHVRIAGVAGLEFNFNNLPVDIVLEFRPNAAILPIVDLHIVLLTGHVRYYL
jgi:hypothetical protein